MRRIVAATLVLLLGCAPRELQGPIPCVRERCRETLTVAVAAFQDDRPVKAPPSRPYPVAEDLSENMSSELAKHLVERFNAFGFFLSSSLVDVSGSPPAPEFLARLAAQGYDAVITGNVPRCMGSTCVIGGDLAGQLVLRFVGFMFQALLPLPLGYYHNEGVVFVTDLRLTDARTGEVVWKGDFTAEVVHYTYELSPGPAIHEAMLEVTQAIMEDMRVNLRSGRQGGAAPEEP